MCILLSVAACNTGGADTAPTFTIDTVEGVEMATSSGDRFALVGWSVDTADAVFIGTLNGPEETRFGRLSGVEVAPNGHVYAADGHALTIRVFSPNGEYLRSVGREGEGPGEFRSIDGVAHSVNGDVFYVRDPLLNRVSVFDSAGAFRNTFLLSRPFAQIARRTSLWVDERDRIFDLTQLGTTPTIDSIGVVSYDRNGVVLDTSLVAATEPKRLLLVGLNGLPKAAALLPFGAFPRATVSPQGRVLGGAGSEYAIDVFEDGQLVRRITKDEAPTVVPSWAPDTVVAIVRRLRENDPLGTVEQDQLPREQPFFNFLLVDADGFLWVAREGLEYAAASRYDVFNPQAQFVGSLVIPPMLLDEVGSDYIAGRRVDALGVETVAIFRLSRSP